VPERPGRKATTDSLGSVFDALPIGLYVVDRNLQVVSWNRGREQGPLGRPRARVREAACKLRELALERRPSAPDYARE